MRHVDDGLIHAWLDGQVADPAEAAWIEQHVRTCAACAERLAEERSTFEQANAILSDAALPAVVPPFSDIAARAAGAAKEAPAAASPARRQTRMLQLGWAASLILAAGIGWLARDLADTRGTITAPDATQARATDPAAPAPVQESDAPERATTTAPAPAPERQAAADRRVADEAGRVAAPPPVRGQVASATPPAPPVTAPPAPIVPPEAFTPQAATAAATAPAPLSPPAQRVTVTGDAAARGETVANTAEWRTLPRTEAAAEAGMPLYGIDGLDPVLTTVSPDRRVVRTTYRLASGEVVELEQRRAGRDAPPPQPQETARALTGRAGIAATAAPSAPRILSVARGDIQLTLRTVSEAPDLAALSAILRVD